MFGAALLATALLLAGCGEGDAEGAGGAEPKPAAFQPGDFTLEVAVATEVNVVR